MKRTIVPRTLVKKLLSLAEKFPVVSVTGPRQSGKTTLCRAIFSDYAYLNLENMDDRMAAEEDPLRFLRPHSRSGVVIDEAQKAPNLFSWLQGIVDESGEMGKYVLTGSQNFLLLEKISQSLAGRVAVCHLMPFDFDELTITGLAASDLDHAMFAGGYPPLYDREIPPVDFFPSYIQTYIERDVRTISNIGNLATFQRFVKLCAGRVGQLLNLSALGNDVGVDYKTIRSWISILEAGFIVFLLQPHYRNFNKRVVKQPKIYFYDTGLLCALLEIRSPEQLCSHYLRGSIFESFVVSEYIKSRLHTGLRSDAFFWRDSTGHEIDLVLEKGDQLWAVEIKSGETLQEDFFKGLKYFKGITSSPDEHFCLIYGGDQDFDRKHGRVIGWKSLSKLAALGTP